MVEKAKLVGSDRFEIAHSNVVWPNDRALSPTCLYDSPCSHWMETNLFLACLIGSIEHNGFQFQIRRVFDFLYLIGWWPFQEDVILLPFAQVRLDCNQLPAVEDRALDLILPSLVLCDIGVEQEVILVFLLRLLLLDFLFVFLCNLDARILWVLLELLAYFIHFFDNLVLRQVSLNLDFQVASSL